MRSDKEDGGCPQVSLPDTDFLLFSSVTSKLRGLEVIVFGPVNA
jgi:hypothetical protein